VTQPGTPDVNSGMVGNPRQDTDISGFSMFISAKFDSEMTESSGITGNES